MGATLPPPLRRRRLWMTTKGKVLEKKVVQSIKIIDILCIDLEVAPGADSTLHAIGGTFQRGNIAEA